MVAAKFIDDTRPKLNVYYMFINANLGRASTGKIENIVKILKT